MVSFRQEILLACRAINAISLSFSRIRQSNIALYRKRFINNLNWNYSSLPIFLLEDHHLPELDTPVPLRSTPSLPGWIGLCATMRFPWWVFLQKHSLAWFVRSKLGWALAHLITPVEIMDAPLATYECPVLITGAEELLLQEDGLVTFDDLLNAGNTQRSHHFHLLWRKGCLSSTWPRTD